MALIRCPDCKHDISDQAPTCPHCGRPIGRGAAPKKANPLERTGDALVNLVKYAILIGFLGFLLAVGVFVFRR